VAEAIDWVNSHRWHSYMHDQMQFADATGDAVIISAGADGEVAFTRKSPGDGYLVSTNFNVANPTNGYGYPCWRYDTATKRLARLLSRERALSIQDAVDVLDAVHVERGASWTIESLVADLPNGIVHLYYFHQFDRPVVLNVATEIAKGRSGRSLSALFPEDVRQEAARRYERIRSGRSGWQTVGKAWAGLVAASLVLVVIGLSRKRQGVTFWVPVTAILGPLGLLAWLVAGRSRGAGGWRSALVEATGDVVPTVVAFTAAVLAIFLSPAAQASQPLQLMLFCGLPVLAGLLAFQGPLLASATRQRYLRIVIERAPHAWAAANLGIAGILAPGIALANLSVQMPLPPWIAVAWWASAVAGALPAMLLLLPYEAWAVRRGLRAWSVLARGERGIVTVPLRAVWWWIPLSWAALIGGMAVQRLLQQALGR